MGLIPVVYSFLVIFAFGTLRVKVLNAYTITITYCQWYNLDRGNYENQYHDWFVVIAIANRWWFMVSIPSIITRSLCDGVH